MSTHLSKWRTKKLDKIKEGDMITAINNYYGLKSFMLWKNYLQ